ncbi:MAG: hypothetical protein KC457_15650, partial [Myxococcales bacterium]|nr:hypothetical protein [Myxococcales bacterium]
IPLPSSVPTFAPASLTGAWYLLFTSDAVWRRRTHPRMEYAEAVVGEDGRERLDGELRFRQQGMTGVQRKLLPSIDEHEGQGVLRRRRQGLLPGGSRRWSVPAVDPGGRWFVAYQVRLGFGERAELDVFTRDPSIPQARLDEILAGIQAAPLAAARAPQLYATVQDWVPPRPYRLGLTR